ncbi:glycosyl transferase family 1 [Tamlana nanhaiensis]|uniref:Glycosyl transferase family 1 n=1 Tax=Neotamlana nanhaiensis TaxID=1382798 RepID=A0A0D7WA41_9FLAO|nr:glycosyltransferase [Tamlana nanhaiensis]KJD34632.1 glycosyl transferase family 1 [Tamlana nanhaiensis]
MKVLHVIDRMDPEYGGVCQAVRTIVKGLSDFEVVNQVVSLDDPKDLFLENDPLTIYALGPAHNPWSYSKNLKPWLIENVKNFNVIIIHGLWQYHSYVVNKVCKNLKNKPKIFVMPHGMLDPYFQRAAGRKLKAIRNILYWKFFERHVVNNAYGLLFTCEEERKLAHKPFKPYKPLQEFVVGLGVELPPELKPIMFEAFYKRCPEVKDHNYILFLSRIHEKKGVDLLLRAYEQYAQCNEKSENKNNEIPKLVIAGPGIETAYGKSILNLVEKSNFLRHHVHFPGMLKDNAKWGSFYGCEAFILPSHQENFGIAVVEALACNKPVLISNQVNIWTEIETSKGGVVNADTVEGTYKILKQFLNSTSFEKEELSMNARQCFETYFAVEPAAKKMLIAVTN